jgi:hypothetical protein
MPGSPLSLLRYDNAPICRGVRFASATRSATIATDIWKNRRARASAFRRTGIAGSLGDERTMNVDAGRAIVIFILI